MSGNYTKLKIGNNIVSDTEKIIDKIKQGDFSAIAKSLSVVENNLPQCDEILFGLQPNQNTKVIGITGPPGAGKSTLVNALLKYLVKENKKIAVLSVDPSSPFNFGALLGDRIRMSDFYLNPNVFIRSVASRGSLGGLSVHIIEMLDVLKSANFDYVFVETVGVGQSEVEIAGIADTTIVTLVPEAGDEIQTMKAGVMEIADIFIVNKGDRSNADEFVKNLKILAHTKAKEWEIPVLKTIASEDTGIAEVVAAIEKHHEHIHLNENRHLEMLTIKAFQLIQQKRMQDVKKEFLQKNIQDEISKGNFNLYKFVSGFH